MKTIKSLIGILTITAALAMQVHAQSTATATATNVDGFVVAIGVTYGGSGYGWAPLVTITGGGGTGAGAFATISNGVVTAITVTNAGFDYTSTPQVIVAAPSTTPFSSSLVLDLSFDGTVVDVGPYNFTVITNGGGTFVPDRFSQANSALSLNGVNQNIYIPYDARLYPDEFTWSGWVNFQQLSNIVAQLWMMGPNSDERWCGGGLLIDGNEFNYGDAANGGLDADFSVSLTNFVVNTWFQIVVTRTTNSAALFVNGVELASQTGLTPYAKTQSSPWVLGANIYPVLGGFYLFCQVTFDTVHLYNRALLASEVQQLYNYESGFPAITNQPQSVTANLGDTVNFGVAATGAIPLSYQWYKDGNGLPNATNSTLTLTDVQPPQIGDYTVVVSNFVGSVTSSVASLSISNIDSGIWQGLVAYYPFNGNANDESGFGNNGIVNGATLATDRFGNDSSAYSFSTTQSIVTIGNSPIVGGEDRTISFWVDVTTVPQYPTGGLISMGAPQIGEQCSLVYRGYSQTQTGLFDMNGNYAEAYCQDSSFQIGNWVHVVWVYSGSITQSQFYFNGISASITNLGFHDVDSLNTLPSPLYMGSDFLGPDGFSGLLDDVRIYNRALSSNDVAQLYASVTPPTPPSIINQPQDELVNAYDTTSFNVSVTGTWPLSYQWSLNGSNILNAASTSLTITNVEQTDLGSYIVVVTNNYGSVTSSVANLLMYPFIAEPFVGLDTYWGQTNILSVGAWGSGVLNYQWYFNGVAIQDATSSTLLLSAIQFTNAGLYSVVVSSYLGSVTNIPYQVVVNPANVSLKICPDVVIQGTVGYNYIIQSTTDLSNTNSWVVETNITLSVPIQDWNDDNDNITLPSNPQKFYRVLPGQ